MTRFKKTIRPVKNGFEGVIYVVAYISREHKISTSTHVKIPLNAWDAKTTKVVGNNAITLNNIIDKHLIDLKKQIQPGSNSIVEKQTESENPLQYKSFNDYCRKKLSVTNDLEWRSIANHRKIFNFLGQINANINFSDITPTLIAKVNQLCIERKYAPWTIWNVHKTIKCYIRKAINDGLLSSDPIKNPYRDYRLKKVHGTTRPYLTQAEIHLIEKAKIPPSLCVYRDYFLFMCYTGLRVSDLLRVRKEMYVEGILTIKPLKTQSFCTTVALPLKVLYGGAPDRIWSAYGYNFLFNKKTSQLINQNIKLIAKSVGITKKTSCHVARHTFLTNIAQRTGDIFKVMKLGGLRKPETAMIYIHLAEMDSGEVAKGINWD